MRAAGSQAVETKTDLSFTTSDMVDRAEESNLLFVALSVESGVCEAESLSTDEALGRKIRTVRWTGTPAATARVAGQYRFIL